MFRRIAVVSGVLSCDWLVVLLCGVCVSITGLLHADVILPTGLAPGSQYQIAFVTSDGTTATSSDIADYNNFVTQEAVQNPALAALGANWDIIGSTATTTALNNALIYPNVPIYNTAGQLVVSASGQLWGSQGIVTPILYDENGDAASNYNTCTGSYAHGGAVPGKALGQFYYDSANNYWESPWLGLTASTSKTWINWGYWHDKDLAVVQSRQFYFYALSSPITVPEPGTFVLLAASIISLVGYAWRRRNLPPTFADFSGSSRSP